MLEIILQEVRDMSKILEEREQYFYAVEEIKQAEQELDSARVGMVGAFHTIQICPVVLGGGAYPSERGFRFVDTFASGGSDDLGPMLSVAEAERMARWILGIEDE